MLDLRPQSTEGTTERIHEDMDLQVRGILIFAVSLVVMTIAIFVGLRLIVGYFQEAEVAAAATRPPLFSEQSGQYTGPNLQENPNIDLTDKRKDEDRRLSTYSDTIDGAKARIPIGRAIEIISKKGLPTRDSAPAKSAEPQTETKGTP